MIITFSLHAAIADAVLARLKLPRPGAIFRGTRFPLHILHSKRENPPEMLSTVNQVDLGLRILEVVSKLPIEKIRFFEPQAGS